MIYSRETETVLVHTSVDQSLPLAAPDEAAPHLRSLQARIACGFNCPSRRPRLTLVNCACSPHSMTVGTVSAEYTKRGQSKGLPQNASAAYSAFGCCADAR